MQQFLNQKRIGILNQALCRVLSLSLEQLQLHPMETLQQKTRNRYRPKGCRKATSLNKQVSQIWLAGTRVSNLLQEVQILLLLKL